MGDGWQVRKLKGGLMIFHITDAEAYEAPGDEKRTIHYLVDPERTGLRRFMTGLTTLEVGQKTGVASHEAEEMYFVLEGHARMRLGNEDRIVGPETVIVILPNVSHQIAAMEDRVRFLWTSSPPPSEITPKRTWRRVK
jgi:mannose-6-phosphate isomerase-like protein (cupin superfamily)